MSFNAIAAVAVAKMRAAGDSRVEIVDASSIGSDLDYSLSVSQPPCGCLGHVGCTGVGLVQAAGIGGETWLLCLLRAFLDPRLKSANLTGAWQRNHRG
jgi:hypothetical protein